MRASSVKAPPRRLLLREQMALLEYGIFRASSPWLRAILDRIEPGDGHPVLVLPGWRTSDRSTVPMRRVIRNLGYWAHGWRLGINRGPSSEIVAGMQRRLVELSDRHGAKVTLIGQSLGGIYARELAREHPRLVRQIITLASPFRFRDGDGSNVSWLAERMRGRIPNPPVLPPEQERPPIPVPVSAIYSRRDGIVRWHQCIEADGPMSGNIEVRSTHVGMAWNPSVIIAVADRLALPEGTWVPFRPPVGTASLYRPAVGWLPPGRRGTRPAFGPDIAALL